MSPIILGIFQNLNLGAVISEMTSDFLSIICTEPSKILRAVDIADACITVLNTPPHVVLSNKYYDGDHEF